MVTCTGHIGIHEGADGRTDVADVMAIKPNFLTSMGYHIFLTTMLRAHAFGVRGSPLKFTEVKPFRAGLVSGWETKTINPS